MSGETMNRVTKTTVDKWLKENRPGLATYSFGRTKGTYAKEWGPTTSSFQGRGTTWKQVLESLIGHDKQ